MNLSVQPQLNRLMNRYTEIAAHMKKKSKVEVEEDLKEMVRGLLISFGQIVELTKDDLE